MKEEIMGIIQKGTGGTTKMANKLGGIHNLEILRRLGQRIIAW